MTAFLLTWKESGWPHENIVAMLKIFSEKGFVDEPWRLVAHKLVKPGDVVWILKQGRGQKGIFGKGHVTGVPSRSNAGEGKNQWMVPVRFEAFVDPKNQLLIGEETVSEILRSTQIAAQASGYPLDESQSKAFDTALQNSPVNISGTGDWNSVELSAIVAEYFAMLDKEFAGEPYSKTEHRQALMQTVHRSSGSIERKHQNISAVLMKLGLPWINGYKPLGNFQDALLKAVETKLDQDVTKLDTALVSLPVSGIDINAVLVPPPEPAEKGTSRSVQRLVRKFDPAARDAANRNLGKSGEEFILALEIERLTAAGRADLASRVKWVSKEVGDGLGYDIESFEEDGSQIFIEVKTTRGSIEAAFFLSSNELRVSAVLGASFRLYRVFCFGNGTRVYILNGPLAHVLQLEPICYRASVGPPSSGGTSPAVSTTTLPSAAGPSAAQVVRAV